ncbi:hypothetical protein ACH49_13615 [Streptomyces leeuwenhoekii]|uniref:Uncharacterized protein n=1 Tax=Streptomyces leeuwenhoekii TaxID=1437453 RepID=A0ABR5HYZ8_STRLW|nr:hypothetical protein [Streptomyces leeuwenhoekii]KMS79088.1 hypothetical protein ACH49_13615 [Streptomyces leeuwenhoekii]
MTATRLEILGDDGEWHEVPGVASVEFLPLAPDELRERAEATDLMIHPPADIRTTSDGPPPARR